MASADMIRPFVEKAVAQNLGIDKVKLDDDGDIPVVSGTSVTFVRVIDGPVGPMVRFFSPMVSEVEKSPELLERLNDLNMAVPYVQFFWVNDQVMCCLDLDGENLQVEEVAKALEDVVWHADNFDEPMQKEFGGRTMISPDQAAKPPAEGSNGPAGYL